MGDHRPVVSLTSDFGTDGPFVAIMKAVLCGIAPEARIVDVTHEIPPHDVLDAAFHLRCAFSFFPAGSVHLAVVDPEVGSSRRPLLMVTENHCFVAPDNGILSLIPEVEAVSAVYHMTATRYFRSKVSATFHGRDVFAPAAAWLALGIEPAEFGEPVEDWRRLEIPAAKIMGSGAIQGMVLAVDRFGNICTDIQRSMLEQFRQMHDQDLALETGSHLIARQVEAYHSIPEGETAFLINSLDLVEIAAKQRSAASELGVKRGDLVRIRKQSS